MKHFPNKKIPESNSTYRNKPPIYIIFLFTSLLGNSYFFFIYSCSSCYYYCRSNISTYFLVFQYECMDKTPFCIYYVFISSSCYYYFNPFFDDDFYCFIIYSITFNFFFFSMIFLLNHRYEVTQNRYHLKSVIEYVR